MLLGLYGRLDVEQLPAVSKVLSLDPPVHHRERHFGLIVRDLFACVSSDLVCGRQAYHVTSGFDCRKGCGRGVQTKLAN